MVAVAPVSADRSSPEVAAPETEIELVDHEEESEYSDGQDDSSDSDYYGSSDCDEESNDDIGKQVRESLHRTHMHSLNKPLQE